MKNLSLITAFLLVLHANGQYHVSAEDIPRFWETFDRVHATTDSAEQISIIQTNYLDKGTVGLKEFNSVREGTSVNYLTFIKQAKKRLEASIITNLYLLPANDFKKQRIKKGMILHHSFLL